MPGLNLVGPPATLFFSQQRPSSLWVCLNNKAGALLQLDQHSKKGVSLNCWLENSNTTAFGPLLYFVLRSTRAQLFSNHRAGFFLKKRPKLLDFLGGLSLAPKQQLPKFHSEKAKNT